MGGTKGTHLVVDPFPGAPSDAIYLEAVSDGRPIFIIPWEDRYLIGTTDIRFDGDLDYVKADEVEIEYLLRETNLIIPGANLTRDSVLYTYCGVRPLPYQKDGSTGSITRRHVVHDHEPEFEGLLSIIGGKLTTFRSLAEEAVNDVFKKLARKSPPCPTSKAPMPGAETDNYTVFCQEFVENTMFSEEAARRLLHVYGTRSRKVEEIVKQDPKLMEPFSPDTGALAAEIVLAFKEELAETLADLLLRRTMVGLGPSAGLDADQNAARVAQEHLGWDSQRVEDEVTSYRSYIERFHPCGLDNL
jgi:glycerol-3-phosphate dehydrogenase